MASREIDALSAELGSDAPEALSQLDPRHITELTAALRNARMRQKEQLEEALGSVLKHIPLLLRGPVRKVLGL